MAYCKNGKNYYMINGAEDVIIEWHKACKYEDMEEPKIIKYQDVYRWGVFNKADFAEGELDELINDLGEDEYDEYLKLFMVDGSTATFRNSHVDMFSDYGRREA